MTSTLQSPFSKIPSEDSAFIHFDTLKEPKKIAPKKQQEFHEELEEKKALYNGSLTNTKRRSINTKDRKQKNIFQNEDDQTTYTPSQSKQHKIEAKTKEQKEQIYSKQLPIDSYGLIGNMHTSALVGTDGSIDWLCFPRFNSPTVFGRMLDYEKGGFFQIQAATEHKTRQHYWPDTNILVTKFLSKEGVGQLIDFMPVSNATAQTSISPNSILRHNREPSERKKLSPHLRGKSSFSSMAEVVADETQCSASSADTQHDCLIRRLEVVHGRMHFKLSCLPAFDYAREDHEIQISPDKKRVVFSTEKLSLILESSSAIFNLKTFEGLSANGYPLVGIESEFTLSDGSCITFVLKERSDIPVESNTPLTSKSIMYYKELKESASSLFMKTLQYWHRWISKCTYQGRYQEKVTRSALALKLMTYEPSGAILASPTFGLPECIGGSRNWDYRFTWIRDASFTIYALLRIGLVGEADKFMGFIEDRLDDHFDKMKDKWDGKSSLRNTTPPLNIMYGLDGSSEMKEIELNHLEGYKGSKPVRIGNGAQEQLQLDIFGELLDSIYLYNKYGTQISYDLWTKLRYCVNWVCDNWDRKDEGIWEVRGGQRHFLYSKVMCWVAIDRGLRLADKRSFPADRSKWMKVRDEIYEDIMEKGYNKKVGAFVQSYDSETLDASALILPLVFFCSPNDPRMIKTIDAINRTPKDGGLVEGSLVYRYDTKKTDDGFKGEEEGTFNMCSFWLIECLCRQSKDKKRLIEAQLMFEQMLSYTNHLGLFSEEFSFTGEALGNYPQAFTHLALISASFNINRAIDDSKKM